MLRMPRQVDREGRALRGRDDANAPTVRLDEVLRDEQSEPQSFGASMAIGALTEGIENMWHESRVNHPGVVNLEDDSERRRSIDAEAQSALRSPMLEGIADKIRYYL